MRVGGGEFWLPQGRQGEPEAEQTGVKRDELDRLEHAGQRHQACNACPKPHADRGKHLPCHQRRGTEQEQRRLPTSNRQEQAKRRR